MPDIPSQPTVSDADPAAAVALKALERLASAAFGHPSEQSEIITRFLASCYAGAHALPVRLDDFLKLDCFLQTDLTAMLLGLGRKGFPSAAIPKAFYTVGGKEAQDCFLRHTNRSVHLAALDRLLDQLNKHPHSTATAVVLELLQAIHSAPSPAPLYRLGDLGKQLAADYVQVLEGLYGASATKSTASHLRERLGAAGVAS